jgi:DNA modification methylase
MTKGFNKNLDMILENVKRFDTLKDKFHIKLGEHEVRRADARYLDVRDNEIDGILTSPPYSIAVDYIKNDLHALEFFGEDPNKLRDKMVGLRGDRRDKIKNYYLDMKRSIDEMYRVLKDGGYCTIIIGDNTVNGRRLKNEEKFIKLGKESGFTFIKTIRRPILGGFARLRYEYVILFRKF